MLAEILNATNALDAFALTLTNWWVPAKFPDGIGTQWNVPPINREDVATRVRRLSVNLRNIDPSYRDEELRRQLFELPGNLNYFTLYVLPQMASANIQTCLSVLNQILVTVESGIPIVAPDTNWEAVQNSGQIPRQFAQRIRNLEARLTSLEPRGDALEEQIKTIGDAHQAALDLPTDMQTLRETMDEVQSARDNTSAINAFAESDIVAIREVVKAIDAQKVEAEKLVQNIGGAHHAATSAGLASAFTERAQSLNRTVWVWVVLLSCTLTTGAILGYLRLELLQALIQDQKVTGERLWLNAAMSFLAIAAPVWFAWLATKQIGQRFRLAEDYAFKASVARAYEGYRREAARLDENLEKRLFTSALDRLDEPPLRFISTDEFSSPYQEMLASPGFQRMLEKFPDARASLLALVEKVGGKKSASVPGPVSAGD